MLIIEWDEAKRARNLANHGVDFDATNDLEWETARYLPDLRRNYAEGRILGLVIRESRLHVIVFTIRQTGLRVISLRKANDREIVRYEEAVQDP